ncbi:unnamed protein product [Arctia plantaginis]|uniref:Uncharacterized protein n=1 Tax=Arctia plantaginis TaxID=874455 RepID=A0A8S0ZHX8_ARCPL|nr:unnamed protein product [Arctia plantaginis]
MAEHLQEQILQLQAEKAALLLRLEQENKAEVQAILASQLDLDLNKLAELADKVMEIASPNQIYTCAAPSTSSSVLETLVERVEQLGKQVASLSTKNKPGRSRSRSRASSSRSRTSTPGASNKQLLDKPPEAAVLPQADNMSTEPASSAAVPKNSSTSTQQTPYVTRSGRRVRFKTLD